MPDANLCKPPVLSHSKAESAAAATGDDNPRVASYFGPSTFLSPDVQSRLAKLNSRKLVTLLCLDFGIVILATWASLTFQHVAVYVLAVMAIGARQAGIGSVALHDGVHQLLSKNKTINDIVGRVLSTMVFAPLVVDFGAYRQSHFAHHREANTVDDPDHGMLEWFYGAPKWKAMLIFLTPLSGLLFLLGVLRYPLKNWRSNPVGVGVLLAFFGTLIWGLAGQSAVAQLIFWYWVVPSATWGIFVDQIRSRAEHYPEDVFLRDAAMPEVFRTRDVINSWFDSMFMVTRGVNYHLSHHLCPQIPFYNLAELQRQLAKSPIYQRYGHVTHGYHRVLAEYFFQRAEPVGRVDVEPSPIAAG